MVDEERMETVHLYVVREEDIPPTEDYLSIAIAFFSFLALVFMVLASLLVPPVNHDISFTTRVKSFSLPLVTQTEEVTTLATGNGYLPATTATGTITFYNGAIYTQIIPVGTILKGTDGLSVMTDAEAIIPPAAQTTPPTYGQTNVAAQALVAGASGNIPAGDINMACCVTSVIAQNPYTFTGGKNASTFAYLTAQDVERAVAPLEHTLQTHTLALFTQTIVLNPACTIAIHSQPTVGQRTQSARITLSETCHAISYRLNSVKTAIILYSRKLGSGTLSNVQSQIVEIQGGTITLYLTARWNPLVIRRYPAGK